VATVDRWTGREARLLRGALRLSVRGFADYLGIAPRTIAKWESFGDARTPRPEQQQILDTALARATDDERARFEAALAANEPSREHGDRRLDLVGVAEIRDEVRALVAAYDVTPSVSLLAPAARLHAQVMDMRARASTGPVRRELYAAEAEVAILMGQLVWDASQRRDHATASAHFTHAIEVARQINDAVTEAHAVLRQSYIALYGKPEPAAGLALAARAARLSREHSPVLAGLALLHVAEAHAMLGDRTLCETALGQADVALDARTDLDAAADHYSPTQVGRLSGSCYLSLGLPDRAEVFLTGTAAAQASQEKISALVLGNLGLAHLRQRHLDQATAILHLAIDVLERTRGGAGLNVVFAAGRELRPWRAELAVQEVHDRLLGLLATA
jgi:transcriptional regulator with XRE-family HTH domain